MAKSLNRTEKEIFSFFSPAHTPHRTAPLLLFMNSILAHRYQNLPACIRHTFVTLAPIHSMCARYDQKKKVKLKSVMTQNAMYYGAAFTLYAVEQICQAHKIMSMAMCVLGFRFVVVAVLCWSSCSYTNRMVVIIGTKKCIAYMRSPKSTSSRNIALTPEKRCKKRKKRTHKTQLICIFFIRTSASPSLPPTGFCDTALNV